MSISGVGASNLYAIAESGTGASYGTAPTTIGEGNVINIATRPGAMPSESTSRVSGRVVGDYTDRGRTHRVRSTVAGTFGFNIGSIAANSNNIHKMAGISVDTDANYTDQYSGLKSWSIFLPMIESAGTTAHPTTAGIATKGLVFNGMMVSQYTISLPNDNSLVDCSLGFIGRNITDYNIDGTVPPKWVDIVGTADLGTVPKVGQPFETWTAEITYGDNALSVSSFSLNIANTLTPASFVTSGQYIGKPTPSIRNVTGSFSVPYSTSDNGYKGFLDKVTDEDSSPSALIIKVYSTRDSGKTMTITMPVVEIITGQTVNNLAPGYVPMSFSFKAFGAQNSNTTREIKIVNT